MIQEKDIEEVTKMLNWGIGEKTIKQISLKHENGLFFISTFHTDKRMMQGSGKSVLDAMMNYAKTEKRAIDTMEVFYAQ